MAGHAGIWERVARFAWSERADESAESIVRFSLSRESRAQLARKSFVKVLTETGCEDINRQYKRSGSCRRFTIDEYASVILPASCNELIFQLHMRVGPKVLLVTDDIAVMSDFVRQYAQARMHGHKDLRAIL